MKKLNVFKILFLFFFPLLFTSCTHFFYHPDSFLYFDPKVVGYPYKDIFFKSKDGTKLHGWYFKNQKGETKGTVMQFHGNAQNISSHSASLVWMIKNGYNLFTFDYRGFGLSEGSPTPKGVHQDALAALNLAYKTHQKQNIKTGKFVIIGQSLGGAIVSRALKDFKHKKSVDLLVLDSTFASYQDVAFRALKRRPVTMILSPFAYLVVSDTYSPEEHFKELGVRTLVIHSKKDKMVTFKNGEDVYDLLKASKNNITDFWVTDDPHHINFFSIIKKENQRKFLFLLDNI
tara:strand:+ start:152 stop:1015 length:864 start_codon:yes stop_codon:yes gene_type:complete